MPSSIFSSDRIAAGRSWLTVWLVALTLCASAIAGMETLWRHHGFRPGLSSDVDLWCLQRERADAGNPIVLVGASRIQLGFVPEVFRKYVPDRNIIQLALAGDAPPATLRDLADDQSFNGMIICAVSEDTLHPARAGEQEDEVRYYHLQWSPSKKFGRKLATLIQERFTFVNPQLGWQNLLRDAAQRKMPPLDFVTTRPDRTRIAEFDRIDLEKLRKERIRAMQERIDNWPPPTDEQWQSVIADFRASVEKLHARGSQVIFVRYPTSGEFHERMMHWMPRAKYWDTFASSVNAPSLHFQDIPEVADMTCVEGSHLSPDDAARFTDFLGRQLLQMGELPAIHE